MVDVIKSYRRGPVTITKFRVPWDETDPSNCDELIESTRKLLLEVMDAPVGIYYYATPGYSVTAPADSPLDRFVTQARRAQILWNRQAARVMGKGGRRRRIKAEEPLFRQLIFTGMMLINGRPIHPRAWPDSPAWKAGGE